MKLPGYYSSGEFARMAQVSVRTIRFYDKQNILKPSYVTPAGARFYTDSDFVKLQQILLLKYLGFSLDEIQNMTIDDTDYHFLLSSLTTQKKLVADKLEQMQLVENAIDSTINALKSNQEIDWRQMLHLIHLTGMEKSLKTQYENANNISARIRLHKNYSTNKTGWFPWMYECAIVPTLEQLLNSGKVPKILELGCGDGSLWNSNLQKLPESLDVTLSDISEGMIRDVRRSLGTDSRFSFETIDCHHIPHQDNSFDMVIANHLLFYCEDIHMACQEIRRILKPNGIFLCSTYSGRHMQEITQLVQEFDKRIVLAAENLYERFGLENGYDILSRHFTDITTMHYDDSIILQEAEPLVEYILSCHGNQNQYLLDRYHDFRQFVDKKIKPQYHITKDAGLFLCHVET